MLALQCNEQYLRLQVWVRLELPANLLLDFLERIGSRSAPARLAILCVIVGGNSGRRNHSSKSLSLQPFLVAAQVFDPPGDVSHVVDSAPRPGPPTRPGVARQAG